MPDRSLSPRILVCIRSTFPRVRSTEYILRRPIINQGCWTVPGWSSLVLGTWRMEYVPSASLYGVRNAEYVPRTSTPSSLQVPYGGTQIPQVASPVHQQSGTRKFAHWPQKGNDEGFWIISHEPARSLNLRIDSSNHINTCSGMIVFTFLSLPIICELQWIFSKNSNLNAVVLCVDLSTTQDILT